MNYAYRFYKERLEHDDTKTLLNLTRKERDEYYRRWMLSLGMWLLIVVVAVVLLSACGGKIQAPPPEVVDSSGLTKCETIQAEPELLCCFDKQCDYQCSPHEEGIACFIEYAAECRMFETWELECHETGR